MNVFDEIVAGRLTTKEEVSKAATIEAVETALSAVVKYAADNGLVVTVTQVPRQPLAMGNYDTVVGVRPCRGSS